MQIQLLGNVVIHDCANVVCLERSGERCVLAALALNVGDAITLTTLVDYVWTPAEQSDNSLQSIRNYVTKVRSAIKRAGGDPSCLRYERGARSCRLDVEPSLVDYHRFRMLAAEARREHDPEIFRQALAVWQGQALADVGNQWADNRRHDLHAERLDVHLDLLEAQLAAGRYAEVAQEATGLLDRIIPTDRLLLIGAHGLAGSGQHTAIRSWSTRLTRRMRDTVDAAPSEATLTQVEQLIADPQWLPKAPTGQTVSVSAGVFGPASVGGRDDTGNGWTSHAMKPPAVPRQLPPAPTYFTARHRELDSLTTALNTKGQRGTVTVLTITGTGGVGKSSLALHWAHQNRDRFPDGQLFIDLNGYAPAGNPTSPAEAVRGFLDALGVSPDAIPADLNAQVGLYRSLVSDRQMLIVLDNARDSSQINALLPGSPACTVLVTSRDQLSAVTFDHGACPVSLDSLAEADAHALLARRLGEQRLAGEPAAVSELLSWCAGMPLALSIVAGRALTYPDFPLGTFAADLRDTATRLGVLDGADTTTGITTALSSSYNALTQEQATVLGLLSVAPGPDLSLAAASSLTGRPPSDIAAVLQALVRGSLVQQHSPGRYRMHNIVRLFAAGKASEDLAENVRTMALTRLVDYYLHAAHEASQLLDNHRAPLEMGELVPGCQNQAFDNAEQATTWFTVEHPCLLAAQRLAVERRWHFYTWKLAWALDTFHCWHEHVHDNLATCRAGLAGCLHLQAPFDIVQAYRVVARALLCLGQHSEAEDHARRSLALAESNNDLRGQAEVHTTLAWIAEKLHNTEEQFEHDAASLQLWEEIRDPMGVARALNNAGWSLALLGQHTKARTYCEAALTLSRQRREITEAHTLSTLGYIAQELGEYSEALSCYQSALPLFRKLGKLRDIGSTFEDLGDVHLALGDVEQAHRSWRKSADAFQACNLMVDADRVRQRLTGVDPQET